MSESDAECEAERRSRSPALCEKLLQLLVAQSELTPSDVSKSSRILVKILSALDEPTDEGDLAFVQRCLLCSCCALVNRAVCGEVPQMAREQAFLVLALLAKLRERECGHEPSAEAVDGRRALAAEKLTAVHARLGGSPLCETAKRPLASSDALEAAREACDEAVGCLPDLAASARGIDVMRAALELFACVSVRAERARLLAETGDDEFDHLGAAPDERERTAEGIAALLRAAESDAGKMVLNDMIVSLRAPLRLVSLRRTLLMSQKAASRCAENDLDMVTQAHSMAQRGVESVYASAQDEATKVAAVLSALAVSLAKSEGDVRRGDAFAGKVQLPFLATRARPDVESVLLYVEDCDAWCMLRRSRGGVAVSSKRHGLAGLETLVVRMSREKSDRSFA